MILGLAKILESIQSRNLGQRERRSNLRGKARVNITIGRDIRAIRLTKQCLNDVVKLLIKGKSVTLIRNNFTGH